MHLREESLGYFLLKDEPDQLLESGEIVVQQYYDKECMLKFIGSKSPLRAVMARVNFSFTENSLILKALEGR